MIDAMVGIADEARDVDRADVSIVITTYNSAHVIGGTLAAVPEHVHVIVVDNASRDDTIDAVKSARPSAEIIVQNTNTGFGRGCNAGLSRVASPFALLVNPDLTLEPGCIKAFERAARDHPEIDLFGSPDTVHRPRDATNSTTEEIIPVEMISGSCMFLRMEALRPLGFFDENIFLYFEDTDFCLRVRRSGQKIALVRDARTKHLGGASTQKRHDNEVEKMRLFGQSSAYYASKHAGTMEGLRTSLKFYRNWIKRRIATLLQHRDKAEMLAAYMQGWREFREGGPAVLFDNAFAAGSQEAPRHTVSGLREEQL